MNHSNGVVLHFQLLDILKERVKEAFRENVVSDETIMFIARNTAKYENGDARYVLLLLLSAGLAADKDEQSAICLSISKPKRRRIRKSAMKT